MADYTIIRLEDVDDVLGDYPGEMRMMTSALGAEHVAFTHRRMPQHTGGKGAYGHRHKEQEEIYFVASGEAAVQAGRRGRRARARSGRSRSTRDVALGLERRARGRRAHHRVEDRSRRIARRRGVPRELLARVERQPRGQPSTSFTGKRQCSWKAGPGGPAAA